MQFADLFTSIQILVAFYKLEGTLLGLFEESLKSLNYFFLFFRIGGGVLPDQRLRAGGRHLLRGLPRVVPCSQVGNHYYLFTICLH